jgi:arylsulfatase A-like enzyme
MGDWKVADWVIEQLNMDHEKPFFLACGIFRPHLPWYVPREYFDKYPLEDVELPLVKEDDLEDIPEKGRSFARVEDHNKVLAHNQWYRAVQGYQASITFADACVGRVLDALEHSIYRDNTVVVLWSDHGWSLGEKQHWRKFALWEEPIKSVLIISSPHVGTPGQRVTHPVSLVDIYPTLISLCALPQKDALEGVDLSPLLHQPERPWSTPALTTHRRQNHSLRWQNWHYIRYADGSEELYDLDQDPNEWENLAGDSSYASTIGKMMRWLPHVNADPIPAVD